MTAQSPPSPVASLRSRKIRHIGEMTDEVLDAPGSLIWEEAENAKYVKKALLASLLQP